MGSKGDTFENEVLLLIFNNTNIANIGDATGLRGSTAAGNLYVRLFTSAVTVNDSTVGTECAYTGYVAYGVAVARTSGGWTVSTNNASNTAAITFGQCTAGSETVRYVGIFRNNSSTAESGRLYWGQLNSDLAVSSGITPEFAIGDLDINED